MKKRTCKYCGIPLDPGIYHWNAVKCNALACQTAYNADRRAQVKETKRKWKKVRKATDRKCRYCDAYLPPGRWFFCNQWCQDNYLGANRADGDWLFD